jgi:hypothetical protein
VINRNAEIHGQLMAADLVVNGSMQGSIVGGHSVELVENALMIGDIMSYIFEISPQAM